MYEHFSSDLLAGKVPLVEAVDGGIKYHPLVMSGKDYIHGLPDVIRILVVSPGSDPEPLKCRIQLRLLPHHDLRGSDAHGFGDELLRPYVALSYAWQGQKPSIPIAIHHSEGSLSHLITQNLHDALVALRKPTQELYIWADAVCIDQASQEDKSMQLPLMSTIYSEAQHVHIWLGRGTARTGKAFSLMMQVRDLRNLGVVVEKNTTTEDWIAFFELISNDWFRRRWVIQEIALATTATVHCGFYSVPWREFSQALIVCEAMQERIKWKFRNSAKFDHDPNAAGNMKLYSAFQLVALTSDVAIRHDDGRIDVKTKSLESLISTLTAFETTDPKDLIYSVLSLANDIDTSAISLSSRFKNTPNESALSRHEYVVTRRAEHIKPELLRSPKTAENLVAFPIDYNRRYDQVCEDVYRFSCQASKSLDLICRPWCTRVDDKVFGTDEKQARLPTWIRTVEFAPFLASERDGKAFQARMHADPLVGPPGRPLYIADAGYGPGTASFERDGPDAVDMVLYAYGFKLDIVGQIEWAAQATAIPRTWLTAEYTSSDYNGGLISDEFWRTMVGSLGPDGGNAPVTYSLLSQQLFQGVHVVDLRTEKLEISETASIEYLNRITAVVTGRQLARTVQHRRLSLLPPGTRSGDIICILYGCSVPVVMRKTERRTQGSLGNCSPRTPGKEIWHLIGECYMHGMMFGDALRQRKKSYASDPVFYEDQKEFVIG